MNEQRLYSHSNSIALSASAGSGKTYALTTRMLSMLFAGLSPSEIVAITFTRLAANEIRAKLFTRLVMIEEGNPLEVELYSRVLKKESGEIIEAAGRLKRELVRQFSLLQISTIHRFLTRVIRSFPGKTGFVDFTVIEDEEKTALIDDSIEHFYRMLEGQKSLLDRVYRFFMSYRGQKIVTAGMVREIYNNVGNERFLVEEIRDTTDRAEKRFFEKKQYLLSPMFERKILDVMNRIQHMLDLQDRKYLAKFLHGLHSFVGLKNIRGLLVLTPFSQYAQKGLVTYIQYGTRALPESEANGFIELFHEVWRDLQSFVLLEMDYFIHIRFDIYTMIEESYRELKRSMQCIDFADIERIAGEILAGLESIEGLAYRIDSGMRYILIDEFQDTSVYQWKVLRRIVDGALKRGGTLFYVGDVKQSIYRWRGGEPGLFRNVQRELELPGENLPYTYRQNRVLLNFVNRVFGTITDRIFPSYAYEVQLYPPERPKTGQGFVFMERYEDRDELLYSLVEHISRLEKNGVNPNDIAVLCRTNKEIEELEKVLKGYGIPFSSVGKTRIMDDYCGMDLLAILRFVVNNDEELHLAGILRTPLFRKDYDELAGFKDENDRLTTAMVRQKDSGTYEQLMEILSASRYATPSGFLLKLYEICNIYRVYPEKTAVINDFYECACRFEESSERVTIADFVTYLEENSESLTLRVGEARGMTVQTIHASKGLEYQTVILPFLSKSFGMSLDGSLMCMRDVAGNVQRYMLGNRVYVDYFDDRDALDRIKTQAELNYRIDELNTLYVAMTRARENLVILPLASKKGTGIGDVLGEAVSYGYSVDRFPFFLGEVVPSGTMPGREKRFYSLGAPLRTDVAAQVKEHAIYAQKGYAPSEEYSGPGSTAGRVGRLRGLIFHHIMESIERLPVGEKEIERFVHRALSLEGRNLTSAEKDAAVAGVKERVLEALDDGRLLEYFGENGHAEVSVFSRAYRNLLARIDRIVIGDTIRIIDFKTNAIESENNLKELVEYYRTQVVSYCEALSHVYPGKPVRGALYFTEAPFEKRLVEVFDGTSG